MQNNKQKIADSFSKSAKTYDKHADIQKIMAEKLVALLPDKFERVLDIGCGTGLLEELIVKQNPTAEITGIDIASGMIEVSQSKFRSKNIRFLKADGEGLPFSDAEFDLVVSSASLQWMDYKKAFREARRALKPGGIFTFTTFGPLTLKEIKTAGLSVNSFPAAENIKTELDKHFAGVDLENEVLRKTYSDLFELFYYLKEIGAQIPSGNSNKGLTTKNRIKSLFPKSRLTVSYEIILAFCRRGTA